MAHGSAHDLTPVIDLTLDRGTGPFRTRHPIWSDLRPPCNNACPAGEDIQRWLALAQAGEYRKAWEILVADNPLPATHGRVCYHPCETSCNRGEMDAPVSIHAVERFLGDRATAEAWDFPAAVTASGKRVLVIGAGPSGLSAAYHLTRLGHQVEIHEAGPIAGGMLRFGIPAYRLPRAELAAEIARLERFGVRIELNHPVTDVKAEQVAGGFDAVFVAIGAHIGRHAEIPAREAAKILDAVSVLSDVGTGGKPILGRRVVIYGGGNTAMDAARTARRLGAEETLIIYRRDRDHMPAHGFEADEALEEGVKIRWLTSIKEIVGPSLTLERMELDDQGRPHPTGEFDTLQADSVILALGQQTDSGFLRDIPGVEAKQDGTVAVDQQMMTGHPGLFAGGDMVPSVRTVTVATGHGKLAARNIDAWLRGQTYALPARPAVVSFDMLHLPVFSDVDPAAQQRLNEVDRVAGFTEILGGLSEPTARHEAQRCLSCGVCFECDNCFAACPEQAIIKLSPGYRLNESLCTGCATCFEQCPCHAIQMAPEGAIEPAAATSPSALVMAGEGLPSMPVTSAAP
jgi:formate dehydrogenase (NADP+) beta subunit